MPRACLFFVMWGAAVRGVDARLTSIPYSRAMPGSDSDGFTWRQGVVVALTWWTNTSTSPSVGVMRKRSRLPRADPLASLLELSATCLSVSDVNLRKVGRETSLPSSLAMINGPISSSLRRSDPRRDTGVDRLGERVPGDGGAEGGDIERNAH